MARLLVIDDDLAYVELLREHLNALGHEMVALSESRQALEVVKGYDPDLVILCFWYNFNQSYHSLMAAGW